MISSILFSAFGILLIIGAPIAVALGMAAMAAFMSIGKDVTTLVQTIRFRSWPCPPLSCPGP